MDIIGLTLTSAVVGAVVGAGTNELAIILIFRKIIPGQKKRIAQAIQDIASNELMSPERIVDRIKSPTVSQNLTKQISEYLKDEWFTKDLPPIRELISLPEDQLNTITDKFSNFLSDEITKGMREEHFTSDILPELIKKNISTIYSQTPDEIFDDYESIAEKISLAICSQVTSKDNLNVFQSIISANILDILQQSTQLKELLPESALTALKESLIENIPSLAEKISDTLEKDEIKDRLSKHLKTTLNDRIDAKLPKMLKTVGDKIIPFFGKKNTSTAVSDIFKLNSEVDKFCDQLPSNIRDYVKSSEGQEDIAHILEDFIDSLLEMPVNQLFSGTTEESINDFLNAVFEKMLVDANIAKMVQALQEWILTKGGLSIDTLVSDMNIPFSIEKSTDTVSRKLIELLNSNEFENILYKEINIFLNKFQNQPLGRLDRFVSASFPSHLSSWIQDLTINLASDRLGEFTESAGIWDIITETILEYDDKKIETLVRQVANRELKWVTILGGIIGFVVGIIQGIIFSILQ